MKYFSDGCTVTSQGDDSIKGCMDSAASWIESIQNLDGGWEETLASYKHLHLAGQGPSTASQTAWALMGLLASSPATDKAVQYGVSYLLQTQTRASNETEAFWPETLHTGTGFPNHLYLGYSLYSHYFPMMALGRYVQLAERAVMDD